MKLKIIIAILAAALLAYAGTAVSQIIIIDPLPGYGSYEDCYDAEFEKRHLIRKAELPAIKTLASGFKSIAGKHSAVTEHVVSGICGEMYGLPVKTMDPGLESTTKTLLEEMDAAGVKLSAEFMKVFMEAGLIEAPVKDCLGCECDGKGIFCSDLDNYNCNFVCVIEDPLGCTIPIQGLNYCMPACDPGTCYCGCTVNGQEVPCADADPCDPSFTCGMLGCSPEPCDPGMVFCKCPACAP